MKKRVIFFAFSCIAIALVMAISGFGDSGSHLFLAGVAPLAWVEIFKTGKHTDSQGNTKDWTESDLDKIAAYNAEEHEAPVVVGHPKDNAPAYGWVDGLKREGNKLLAKFKDMAPEFVEMLRQKRFKKRSIALYPDLRLRHVGFLGATAPAVKGLKDFEFNDGEHDVTEVEFEEHTEKQKPAQKPEPQKIAANSAATQDYSERINELETEIEEMKSERRKEKFGAFCDSLLRAERMLPSERDAVMGIMEYLDGGELEFADGSEADAVKTFRDLLMKRPKILHFKEFANGKHDEKEKLSPTQQVRNIIAEQMQTA